MESPMSIYLILVFIERDLSSIDK